MNAEKLIDSLKKAGYQGKKDERGNVDIKHEGGNYVLLLDEDDERYLRVLYPRFWEFKEVERTTMVIAAHESTSAIKAAKIHLVGSTTWAAVEYFAADEEAAVAVMANCLLSLQAITKDFTNRVA